MYEKYTGLPDTRISDQDTRPRTDGRRAAQSGARGTDRGHDADAYYSDAPRRRSAPDAVARKRAASRRRKKKLKRRLTVIGSGVLVLALLAGAIALIMKSCSDEDVNPQTSVGTVDVENGRFRSGVYINGMDVSDKRIEDVRDALTANDAYLINNIAIVLSGDGFSKTVTGHDMGATSDLEAVMRTALEGKSNQVYYSKVAIDEGSLAAKIDEINSQLVTPPTDAAFTVRVRSSGKPEFTYIEGQAGVGLDVDATVALVREAFDRGQYQTTLTPTLTRVEPSITVEDVMAHTTLIGSYSTAYDYKGTAEDTEQQREVLIPNRAFNVEKAAEMISNQVVKPGRTFSFNDTVGDRNEKNGWKEANGIFGGDKYTLQYGGGVCQVSTTLYNALLECYPYIELVERQAHSIPSTYVEKGLDATVDTGHIDFRFKNTSEYPLYIFAYTTENRKSPKRKRDIVVQIYGEALPDGETYKPHTQVISETPPGEDEITQTKSMYIGEEQVTADARSSFVIDVYVNRYQGGKLMEQIFLYTDNYPGNPLKKKVGTKPTPTPQPTPTPKPTEVPAVTQAPAATPTPNAEEAP